MSFVSVELFNDFMRLCNKGGKSNKKRSAICNYEINSYSSWSKKYQVGKVFSDHGNPYGVLLSYRFKPNDILVDIDSYKNNVQVRFKYIESEVIVLPGIYPCTIEITNQPSHIVAY